MSTQTFQEHCGDCPQCRAVVEAYFSEMPQPQALCPVGWAILEGMTERAIQTGPEPRDFRKGEK